MFRKECNFTPDELEVFNCRAQNISIECIAEMLNVSVATINRHIKSIKRKMIKVL